MRICALTAVKTEKRETIAMLRTENLTKKHLPMLTRLLYRLT